MVIQANVLNTRVANREASRIAEFLNQAIDYKEPAHSRLLEKPLAAADRAAEGVAALRRDDNEQRA